MCEVNSKVFKGVWIPAEIWTLDALTWMEKCLWAEISFLGTMEKPCFASNAYLAKVFHSTESSISNMISRLKHYKMIKYVGSDGRFRKMVAVIPTENPVKVSRNPSRRSEGRVHSGVKSGSTQECIIDTNIGANKEKPLTPFQGEKENSAVASHSSVQPNLFQTSSHEGHISGSATAELKSADGKKKTPRSEAPPQTIPTELNTPEFNAAWNEFLQHRKEKRAPMTPTAQKNMFGKFTVWGVESAVAAIDTAISNGWTGVFEVKPSKFNQNLKPEKLCSI